MSKYVYKALVLAAAAGCSMGMDERCTGCIFCIIANLMPTLFVAAPPRLPPRNLLSPGTRQTSSCEHEHYSQIHARSSLPSYSMAYFLRSQEDFSILHGLGLIHIAPLFKKMHICYRRKYLAVFIHPEIFSGC